MLYFRFCQACGVRSCPRAERWAGMKWADVREQLLKAAGGCDVGAAVPLFSPLGKYEKMGSRPKACGFYHI